MNALVEERTCKRCGETFPSEFHRGTFAAHCPACKDYLDHRPSVVVERTLVGGPWCCTIESLPGRLIEFRGQKDDEASWRLVVKGQEFGVSWSGRIDIFAEHDFQPGQVVEVSEIEVKHKVKLIEVSRATSPFTQFRGGPAEVTHQERRPADWREGEEVIETRRYLRLDACADLTAENSPDLPRLVWRMADWKTTLKGYGRQWKRALRGAPVAEWRVTGSCRSGRYGATAALAIVNAEHPLNVVEVFDN
jgi:hypothetical protein